MAGFTTKAHICRAMLEAICWQTREVLDAMRADAAAQGLSAVSQLRSLRVDGGGTANALLMQMQADILQVRGVVMIPNLHLRFICMLKSLSSVTDVQWQALQP